MASSRPWPASSRRRMAASKRTSDTLRSGLRTSRLAGNCAWRRRRRCWRSSPVGSTNCLTFNTPSASTTTPKLGNWTVVAPCCAATGAGRDPPPAN